MLRATIQYLMVSTLVLGLAYAAATYMGNRIADSLNSSALLIDKTSGGHR